MTALVMSLSAVLLLLFGVAYLALLAAAAHASCAMRGRRPEAPRLPRARVVRGPAPGSGCAHTFHDS